jgi:hypothetical protein
VPSAIDREPCSAARLLPACYRKPRQRAALDTPGRYAATHRCLSCVQRRSGVRIPCGPP